MAFLIHHNLLVGQHNRHRRLTDRPKLMTVENKQSFLKLIKNALKCKCPKCHEGNLFISGFTLDVVHKCESCGLPLHKHDSADGPAVFIIFILGFALVPLALLLEVIFAPPLIVHAILWGFVILGLTLLMIKPLKALVIELQYTHRPTDIEKK